MNKLKEYIKNVDGVSHTTFDPYGPGVVRIFLIPPKKIKFGISWVVLLNGESILPICMGWAILLREFINEINKFEGKSVNSIDIEEAINKACITMSSLFPKTKDKMFHDDLNEIIDVLLKVARGEKLDKKIGYLSLKDYAKYMASPHRMDLLISSMEKNGHWGCNQKCINCYAANQIKGNSKELTTEEWKKIIDKLYKARIPQITFTGGEPTLRSDLVELVKYSSWFVTRLNTNGQLLTKELCNNLYDASLDAVQVTFYSHKKEIHNLLVGVDGFDKTCEGIKNALDAKLLVSINTPLCELNKDYLDTIKFAQKLGIRYFTCSGLILTGNATTDESIKNRLSKDELKNILVEAIKYCRENDLEIKFTSPGWIEDEFFGQYNMNPPMCGATISNMAISPDGEVIPCQSYLDGTSFGNLLNDKFDVIWESKELNDFKKKIKRVGYGCPLNEKELQHEKNN